VSLLPKDEMSHEVKDQQYNSTPKQQADNGPTFAFLVRFFHYSFEAKLSHFETLLIKRLEPLL
jgi:hypothetical protein